MGTPTTDEVVASMREHVSNLEVIEGLMRDHIKACDGISSPQVVQLFADHVRRSIFGLYEQLTELHLAIDIETHRGS